MTEQDEAVRLLRHVIRVPIEVEWRNDEAYRRGYDAAMAHRIDLDRIANILAHYDIEDRDWEALRAALATPPPTALLDVQTVERVMDFVIDLHDCRDPDRGVPCSHHAQERRLAIDTAYERTRLSPEPEDA